MELSFGSSKYLATQLLVILAPKWLASLTATQAAQWLILLHDTRKINSANHSPPVCFCEVVMLLGENV